MRLFFFGSLMDLDVRRLVMGAGSAELHAEPALLAGYRRVKVRGEAFPVLIPDTGGRVNGVAVAPPDATALDRLRFFEDVDYTLAEREVSLADGRLVPALVCVDAGAIAVEDEPWSFSRWQAVEKPAFLAVAHAFMALYGQIPITEADAAWKAIRARIAAERAAG